MVILENTYTVMSSLNNKFNILSASFRDKVEELSKAREEAESARDELCQSREELRQVREEMKKIQEDQVTHTNELQRLKSENGTLNRERVLLAQQLFTAKETNTRLGLQISKMRTEEFVDSMSNYSYVCAFADALRTVRRTLLPDQLRPFIEDLEKYLADNPPTGDRELPLADLQDLCDFPIFLKELRLGTPCLMKKMVIRKMIQRETQSTRAITANRRVVVRKASMAAKVMASRMLWVSASRGLRLVASRVLKMVASRVVRVEWARSVLLSR